MFTKKQVKLKKELTIFDVFARVIGTTIRGGLFLLPGIVAVYMGSSMFLSYLVATILLIPAMMSKVEFATVIPKSGRVYYFLDRSLDPVFSTVGVVRIRLTLSLKSSFAQVGVGAYLSISFNDIPMVPVSIGIAILLCLINLAGVKKTDKFVSEPYRESTNHLLKNTLLYFTY
jgi:APA family basic amino acid/polyamine antiporter